MWGSAGRVSLASMPVMATTRLSADMAGGLGMTKPGQALIVRFGRGLAAIVLVLTFVIIQSPAVTADTSPSTSTGYWIATTTGAVSAFGAAGAYGSLATTPSPIATILANPTGKGYWLASRRGDVFAFGDAQFFGSPAATGVAAPIVGMFREAPSSTGFPAGGYALVDASGDVYGYGTLGRWPQPLAGVRLRAPLVAVSGFFAVAADGGVFSLNPGEAFHGSAAGMALNAPMVGIAETQSGCGYWLVGADGGVFSFGCAPFLGSMGGKPLNRPIVGMVVTPDGGGYWLLGADGGVFSFGDAPFYGSATRSITSGAVSIASPLSPT